MLTESFPLQDPGDELTVDFPEPETSRPEAAQAGSPKAAEGPQQLNEGLSIQDQSPHFWSRWKTTIRNFGGNLRATWRRASGWLRAKADRIPVHLTSVRRDSRKARRESGRWEQGGSYCCS